MRADYDFESFTPRMLPLTIIDVWSNGTLDPARGNVSTIVRSPWPRFELDFANRTAIDQGFGIVWESCLADGIVIVRQWIDSPHLQGFSTTPYYAWHRDPARPEIGTYRHFVRPLGSTSTEWAMANAVGADALYPRVGNPVKFSFEETHDELVRVRPGHWTSMPIHYAHAGRVSVLGDWTFDVTPVFHDQLRRDREEVRLEFLQAVEDDGYERCIIYR